ncbi:cyclin-dependent kinase inhibitor 1B-like [Labrus mixtus]|uniref:cyclin-dependent kinase inhibitor 1B-like n=1 Tax=Labrus mixtus TaxID=508554 RepID=UPI0029C017FC|nr:cyclin-dependent kinase inhibitor 1B-like [Labrus mixtus]
MCNKMSDVRLSNASPTVERVDARQQDNVRPPTRRNLFGTPDREETRRYFEASIQESVQAFVEEYNFDVVNDRPLTPPRNYDWQEDNDAPEFFRRPPHRREQPQREVERPGENNRLDAEERGERQPDHQQDRNGSRKRRSGSSGPCSDESQSKRSHSDEEDDDQAGGAASQAVEASEERPEVGAEDQ